MSAKIRKFLAIVIGTYLGGGIVIVGFSILGKNPTYGGIAMAFFVTGIVGVIFGVLLLGGFTEASTISPLSPLAKSDAKFREGRKGERPVQLVVWAVITGSTLLSITGYLWLRLAAE